MRKKKLNELAVAKRRAMVMDLRCKGHSYREIAEITGCRSLGTLHKDVQECCREMAEREYESTVLLRTQMARLYDGLLSEWVEKAVEDPTALDRVLRIAEAKRKLFGLDAPQEIHVTDKDVEIQVEFIEAGTPRLRVVDG